MRVTPLDIRKQEFRKVMRGLDSEEVYAFLQTVADEYEVVLSDNKNLRERMVELEDRLKEYKKIEINLRNTLLTAEKITTEAKENARREASLIVREAEVEAEKAAETIRAHTMQLRREILELKKQKDNYITRLKTLLESHRQVLVGFEEDFSEVDRAIDQIGQQVEMDIKQAVTPPRMSRRKITEDTVGGPRDKVTWDDERRREDESRPSMPKPDWHGKQDHERDEASPEDSDVKMEERETRTPSASTEKEFSPAYAEAPPAFGARNQDAVSPLDTTPIGAVDEVLDACMDGGARTEVPRDRHEQNEVNDGLDNGEARRIVEQSFKERLYPEARIDESGRSASRVAEGDVHQCDDGERRGSQAPHAAPTGQAPRPHGSQAPQAGTHPAEHVTRAQAAEKPGADTVVMEAEAPQGQHAPKYKAQGMQEQHDVPDQVELKATQDDWRHYEVQDQKPDWSTYEVPRSQSDLKKQAASPTENEVEKALAGLTEMTATADMENMSGQPRRDKRAKESPAAQRQPEPAVEQREKSATVPPAAQALGIKTQQKPAGEAEGETPHADEPAEQSPVDNGRKNSVWSMDQLRKNLSNFVGREEEREEERDDAREE